MITNTGMRQAKEKRQLANNPVDATKINNDQIKLGKY
jgi:hypothetical protein